MFRFWGGTAPKSTSPEKLFEAAVRDSDVAQFKRAVEEGITAVMDADLACFQCIEKSTRNAFYDALKAEDDANILLAIDYLRLRFRIQQDEQMLGTMRLNRPIEQRFLLKHRLECEGQQSIIDEKKHKLDTLSEDLMKAADYVLDDSIEGNSLGQLRT